MFSGDSGGCCCWGGGVVGRVMYLGCCMVGICRSMQIRAIISSICDLSEESKLDHCSRFDLGSEFSSEFRVVTSTPITTLACLDNWVGGGLNMIMVESSTYRGSPSCNSSCGL